VDWLLRAVNLPGGWWLEPSAGEGAIIRAVNARRPDVKWTAIELREEAMGALVRSVAADGRSGVADRDDFLTAAPRYAHIHRHDVVCGNPPYGAAAEHVARALGCAPVVAMLLRLNFLGSQKRLDFWRRNPADVYVLSERPSFDGEGTDATEYAWFVWTPESKARGYGHVRVLGPDEGQLSLVG
jgi:hypothetical protein